MTPDCESSVILCVSSSVNGDWFWVESPASSWRKMMPFLKAMLWDHRWWWFFDFAVNHPFWNTIKQARNNVDGTGEIYPPNSQNWLASVIEDGNNEHLIQLLPIPFIELLLFPGISGQVIQKCSAEPAKLVKTEIF